MKLKLTVAVTILVFSSISSFSTKLEVPHIVQLIANPEKYDGKVVETVGVLKVYRSEAGVKSFFLFESIERSRIELYGLGIRVYFTKDVYYPSDEETKELDGKYVVIRGKYSGGEKEGYVTLTGDPLGMIHPVEGISLVPCDHDDQS